MRIARIATVRGPVPVVQQSQEASSGPVGLILTRQGIPVWRAPAARESPRALSPATMRAEEKSNNQN